MSQQDKLKAELNRLTKIQDREEPYAFVGRNAELNTLIEQSDPDRLPPKAGFGGTIIIMGAPGAGKSSLLYEFAKQINDENTAIIEIESLSKDSDEEKKTFFREISSALHGTDDPARGKTRETTRKGLSIPVWPFKSKLLRERTTDTLPNVTSFAQVKRRIQDDNRGKLKFKPCERVVVLMDEIQNIKKGSWAADVIEQAHKQRNLPVKVICAGLADSLLAIGEAGISRPAQKHVIYLDSLSHQESMDAVKLSVSALSKFGLEINDEVLESCAREIADKSNGWPMHITNYLGEVFCQLRDMTPEISMERMDLDDIIKQGNINKSEYYNNRIKASCVGMELLGPVVQFTQEQKKPEMLDIATVINKAASALRKENPENATVRAFDKIHDGDGIEAYKSILHAGIITEREIDDHHIPIPSLASHIKEACRVKGISMETLPKNKARPLGF